MMAIRHKFHAKPQKVDDFHFASSREAKHYLFLKKLVENREVLFFLRQVPLHLPGGIKYVCDFVVFWQNGEVTFEDVKGFKTKEYKTKKKLIEAMYPLEIVEI